MSGPAEFVLVPKAALLWLNGEGPDHEGLHFGESADAEERPGRGRFWWRKRFKAMLEAAPKPILADDREEVARAMRKVLSGTYIPLDLAEAAIVTLQGLGWRK